VRIIQDVQKVSVHLTITVQSSGTQRRFDHPVFHNSTFVPNSRDRLQ